MTTYLSIGACFTRKNTRDCNTDVLASLSPPFLPPFPVSCPFSSHRGHIPTTTARLTTAVRLLGAHLLDGLIGANISLKLQAILFVFEHALFYAFLERVTVAHAGTIPANVLETRHLI
jgi:hypothetical protein